ncbi:negative cofactor 2 alpha isoform X2 [Lycorma delicatula]
MQTDEEVGKVAQAVPVIISRTLELFVESLLTKTMQITLAKSAKTLSPSHMKQCILSESRFDFLKDLVKSLPDSSTCDDDNASGSACLSPAPTVPTSTTYSSGPRQPDILIVNQAPLPEDGCILPDSGETLVGAEYEARIFPTTTVCQNSEDVYSVRMNPNFYTETPPVQINSRPNHFSSSPSAGKKERSSSPPVLVVDEDYDT